MAISLGLFLSVGTARSAPPPVPLPPDRTETRVQLPPVILPDTAQSRTYSVTKPAIAPQQGRALPRISVPEVPSTTSNLPILAVPEAPMERTQPEAPRKYVRADPDDALADSKNLNVTNQELAATRSDIFNVENDAELLRRIRNQLAEEEFNRQSEDEKKNSSPKLNADAYIPPKESITSDKLTYMSKTMNYPPQTKYIHPAYVSHRPLYFEEVNSERYGWELGIAQPAISALYFYKDVLFWPAHLASNVRERYDTNRGKCLPGSPVPYYLYPPQISLLGLSAEASAVIATAAFIVP